MFTFTYFQIFLDDLGIDKMEQRKDVVKNQQLKRRAQRVANESDWPAEWQENLNEELNIPPSPKTRAVESQTLCAHPCKNHHQIKLYLLFLVKYFFLVLQRYI
jgi:hypothetical protein